MMRSRATRARCARARSIMRSPPRQRRQAQHVPAQASSRALGETRGCGAARGMLGSAPMNSAAIVSLALVGLATPAFAGCSSGGPPAGEPADTSVKDALGAPAAQT
jgi:hypothetical protein